jgi:hypothetical protein
MKILDIVCRVLLGLLLLMPVAGAIGLFPPPTADLYTPEAWPFMSALLSSGYMLPLMGVVFAVCLVLLILNKTALMAVLLAPISVNVLFFHIFLQNDPPASASFGVLLVLLNVYFLWRNWPKYKPMWA